MFTRKEPEMEPYLHLVAWPAERRPVWPSIAVASSELRRRRHLQAVPAQGRTPSSPLRVAPPDPTTPFDRRK
jgi:hypothetical protein